RMTEPILSELRDALLTRAPLDALSPAVWRRTGALNTWGTNAIEGNTLTRKDVERVLLEGRSVSNRPLPDVLETIQHEHAFESLLRRRPDPVRHSTSCRRIGLVTFGLSTQATRETSRVSRHSSPPRWGAPCSICSTKSGPPRTSSRR